MPSRYGVVGDEKEPHHETPICIGVARHGVLHDAGWSTTPKADGELYAYEETIPDSWKDADVAKEHPCVLYRFRDTSV